MIKKIYITGIVIIIINSMIIIFGFINNISKKGINKKSLIVLGITLLIMLIITFFMFKKNKERLDK